MRRLRAQSILRSRDILQLADILKHTPSELAYNQALERSIEFHKDLEFLITSMSKRRDEALEMLSRYREGLGRRAKEVTEEILNAEYKVIKKPRIHFDIGMSRHATLQQAGVPASQL